MFDPKSRYANLKRMTITTKEGLTIQYVSRRFLPQGEHIQIVQQVSVITDDRIDLVTSRAMGDPELFWRICDANNAMHPLDLTQQPGRVLLIPSPWS